MIPSLDISGLAEAYASGRLTPERVIGDVFDRIAARGERPVWISLPTATMSPMASGSKVAEPSRALASPVRPDTRQPKGVVTSALGSMAAMSCVAAGPLMNRAASSAAPKIARRTATTMKDLSVNWRKWRLPARGPPAAAKSSGKI